MTCISFSIGKGMSFDSQDKNFSIGSRLIFSPLKCERSVLIFHKNRNQFLRASKEFFLRNSYPSEFLQNSYKPKEALAFWTSLLHYQVSLASLLLCLVTPNSSEANFQTQVATFIHILFASPPSSQEPSSITLSSKA